jgi:predicted DNA-binding ribbon-helix-helix protein
MRRRRVTSEPNPIDRVQTGIRLERRLVKVLKALAEYYDLPLGELIEDLVVSTFAGRRPFSAAALARAAEFMKLYGLDLDSMPGASVEDRP